VQTTIYNFNCVFLIIYVLTNLALSYGFIFADTYSEIESGLTVDYFCETDEKFNNEATDIKLFDVTSCIFYRSADSLIPAQSTLYGYKQAMPGDKAATNFVCDP
jgi:hypothetical protein